MQSGRFGGGHISAIGGMSSDGGMNDLGGMDDAFELILNDQKLSILSAGDVKLAAGASRAAEATGGRVQITAGDGTHLHGGQGGGIRLVAGDGYAQAAYDGDHSDGGGIELLGGMTFEVRF
jgi:hypothetical protein